MYGGFKRHRRNRAGHSSGLYLDDFYTGLLAMSEPFSFSTIFVTGLVTNTAKMTLEASARLIKRRFESSEQRKALESALTEGLTDALKTFCLPTKPERDHYEGLFAKF